MVMVFPIPRASRIIRLECLGLKWTEIVAGSDARSGDGWC